MNRFAVWICSVLLVLCMASSCDDGCLEMDMRCRGTLIEICNADERWEKVVDCTSFINSDGTSMTGCYETDDEEAYCYDESDN